jgi:hypothetical protein
MPYFGSSDNINSGALLAVNITTANLLGSPPPWSSSQSSWLQNRDVLCFL